MSIRDKYDELLAETSEAQQDAYAASPETLANPQELIRRRAYELYEQRREGEGSALTDWLEAEAEVNAALGTPAQDAPDDERRWQTASMRRSD
ncbi:MAG TPA: DUF2934 domain-containing protein [Blastocatellia bacterium]|nr:DUF2934 domain-containing protein [Blastocatellia bacterium]